MTRIVVVGEPAEAGLRDSLVRAFRLSGCTVDLLDLGPWKPSLFVSAAFRQPALGAGFRRGFRRLVGTAIGDAPADLVLVVKGALLDRGLIGDLRSRFGSPVVCWNPDSPFDTALSNRGAGIPQAISAYDAYITWADDIAEQLSSISAKVLVVPFAWDPGIMQPTKGRGIASGRIVFIGTGSPERSAALQRLAHLRPLVFGCRWPKIEGVEFRPPITGIEFCRIVGEAKWNLNLLRPQNALSHNMRTFELVGAGGNQVAPDTGDHWRFLGTDSRTILFRNAEDLEAILRSDPSTRKSRLSSLLDDHTYVSRARQILRDLNIC
jgi:hypothetical protein